MYREESESAAAVAREAAEKRDSEYNTIAAELAAVVERAGRAETAVNEAMQAMAKVSGVLEKRGHKWTKGWRPRQCILEGQTLRCACL